MEDGGCGYNGWMSRVQSMWPLWIALVVAGCADKDKGKGKDTSQEQAAPTKAEDAAAAKAERDEPEELSEAEAMDAGLGAVDGLTARPDWVKSATPMSASCTDDAVGLACVGVSPYSASIEQARQAARKAAEAKMAEVLAAKIGGKRKAAMKAVTAAIGVEGPQELRAQDGDWYWEEYAKVDTDGTEMLGFQRLVIAPEVKDKLIELGRQAAR